jgi:hypothetical protein
MMENDPRENRLVHGEDSERFRNYSKRSHDRHSTSCSLIIAAGASHRGGFPRSKPSAQDASRQGSSVLKPSAYFPLSRSLGIKTRTYVCRCSIPSGTCWGSCLCKSRDSGRRGGIVALLRRGIVSPSPDSPHFHVRV